MGCELSYFQAWNNWWVHLENKRDKALEKERESRRCDKKRCERLISIWKAVSGLASLCPTPKCYGFWVADPDSSCLPRGCEREQTSIGLTRTVTRSVMMQKSRAVFKVSLSVQQYPEVTPCWSSFSSFSKEPDTAPDLKNCIVQQQRWRGTSIPMQEKYSVASTRKTSENLCWEVWRGGLLPAGSFGKSLVEWVACKMWPGRKNRV